MTKSLRNNGSVKLPSTNPETPFMTDLLIRKPSTKSALTAFIQSWQAEEAMKDRLEQLISFVEVFCKNDLTGEQTAIIREILWCALWPASAEDRSMLRDVLEEHLDLANAAKTAGNLDHVAETSVVKHLSPNIKRTRSRKG